MPRKKTISQRRTDLFAAVERLRVSADRAGYMQGWRGSNPKNDTAENRPVPKPALVSSDPVDKAAAALVMVKNYLSSGNETIARQKLQDMLKAYPLVSTHLLAWSRGAVQAGRPPAGDADPLDHDAPERSSSSATILGPPAGPAR